MCPWVYICKPWCIYVPLGVYTHPWVCRSVGCRVEAPAPGCRVDWDSNQPAETSDFWYGSLGAWLLEYTQMIYANLCVYKRLWLYEYIYIYIYVYVCLCIYTYAEPVCIQTPLAVCI